MERRAAGVLLRQRGDASTQRGLQVAIMVADMDAFTREEGESLRAESEAARGHDRQLARELRRPRPCGPTSSSAYLQELGSRPPLSAGAEGALIAASQAGDPQARDKLIEAFLPLIAGVARVYRGSQVITRVELMQEGVVGLLRALERYDPGRGVPFWGYASWWVRQAMQQLIAELTRPIVLSDRSLRQLSALKRAHHELTAEHGREPTAAELADQTGFSPAQVADLVTLDRTPRSIEEPMSGPDGELGAFGELLVDPLAEDAYEQLLQRSEIEQIGALLGTLNDRERMILRARYGLDGPERSLRDLGEQTGISAERVRQIEHRALGKLRSAATRAPSS